MSKSPYDLIGETVKRWCEKNSYQTMLVTILLGYEWEEPHEETHILDYDGSMHELVWDMDWWEGQPYVKLVGFTPLYKVNVRGSAPDVARVRRGEWVKAEGSWATPGGDPVWECSECGMGRHVYGIEHGTYGAGVAKGQWVSCPNCGASMGKEEEK